MAVVNIQHKVSSSGFSVHFINHTSC